MKLDDFIKKADYIAIAGHINPDADAVGSCLAVYNHIRKSFPDKNVTVYLNKIPNIFKFLKGADLIVQADEKDTTKVFDLFITLDCGDMKRLGPAGTYFKNAKRTVCVDHHLSNSSFADENYVVPDASSTCELITDIIPFESIDKDIAECLYTGLIGDTGVFQYSCTSSKTMNLAGRLMDMGIDYPKIVSSTFYVKTYEQNRIMGQALLKSKLYDDGDVIASVITKKDMREFNVASRHMEGIVEQLRNTKGVEVSIFLYELESGEFRVSMRATGDVNLAKLAEKHGGGGHAKAAGATITGDPWKAIDGLVAEVREELGKIRNK